MKEEGEEKETRSNGTTEGNNTKQDAPSSSSSSSIASLFLRYSQHLPHIGIALVGVVVSLLLTGNVKIVVDVLVNPLYQIFLYALGTTLGVGLGLGLAIHIYESLDSLQSPHQQGPHGQLRQSSHDPSSRQKDRKLPSPLKKSAPHSLLPTALPHHDDDDENSYPALMASAGYDVVAAEAFLRGQVTRSGGVVGNLLTNLYYPFTHTDTPQSFKAVQIMKDQWPALPSEVSYQLGRFMEHIMRDFISSWYSYIDYGCLYVEERKLRKLQEEEEAAAAAAKQQQAVEGNESKQTNGGGTANPVDSEEANNSIPFSAKKMMVFTTSRHRPIPMLNAMYHSMGIIFGNLATRVEGANIFSLLLIKWVKVISHTFRVYRQMRKLAHIKQLQKGTAQTQTTAATATERRGGDDDKNNNNNQNSNSTASQSTPTNAGGGGGRRRASTMTTEVSEMAIAKEFLIKGKLHRAITFGMDVPSVLFADADGKQCGVGSNNDNSYSAPASLSNKIDDMEDSVLEQRLFGTRVLLECEMDYNRVLGHRLVRALLPRAEFSSPIIRTMMTEMMASCVLSPLMGCFIPDYVNGWILFLCAPSDETEEDGVGNGGGDETKKAAGKEEVGKTEENGDNDEGLLVKEKATSKNKTGLDEGGVEMTMSMANLGDESFTDMNKSHPNLGDRSSIEMTMSQTDFFKEKKDNVVLDDDDEGIDNVGETSKLKILAEESDDFNNDEADAIARDTDEEEDEGDPLPTADFVLPLLTMSLIEMQRFVDFEECRDAGLDRNAAEISWTTPGCREAVTQLVLVIEAALIHGRRKTMLGTPMIEVDGEAVDVSDRGLESVSAEVGEGSVEVSMVSPSSNSAFTRILLELTNDVNGFEDRIMRDEEEAFLEEEQESMKLSDVRQDMWTPEPNQLSTLRSMIASWLQSGQAHRIISVLMNAKLTVLKPFFHKHSFIRTPENAGGFVRQLRSLNGVAIVVDTMSALSSANLDVNEDGQTIVPKPDAKVDDDFDESTLKTTSSSTSLMSEAAVDGQKNKRNNALKRFISGASPAALEAEAEVGMETLSTSFYGGVATLTLPNVPMSSAGCPRFLDFRRNENFASSLRSERDRRMQSWSNATSDKDKDAGLQIICRRKGSTKADVTAHREMHQVARIFYAGTNMVALRNGARRKEATDDDETEVIPLSLLTVEMACQRRRLEVPDDDSSFLLRAQPRPLNAVGVHRDQRNHDQSFKCFAATYEEPAIRPSSQRFGGGRYIRKCLLRYFPNDRTAQIVIPQDTRSLDQRRDSPVPTEISVGSSKSYLSPDFLRDRHLCQKWTPKGATPRSGSILASSVMESGDFSAVPRSGRAVDFVYRMSLFERPMVDLAGKKFTVLDSASMGPHRADASALEMSDPSISIALCQIGKEWQMKQEVDRETGETVAKVGQKSSVEMGKDGYPIIWMKYTRKNGENTVTEVKSYRASYVRAALMVTAARQEAQLQCLMKCVRAGSARSATKQRTEAYLKPAAKLLEYANSIERQKESVLLRDLKLGMNHIDCDQLRRNGLRSPRYPTEIRALSATVESAAQVKENLGPLAVPGMVTTTTVYKIRCRALVALQTDVSDEREDLDSFMSPDGKTEELFIEEWVVYRSMKEFTTLHKHLKTQVNQTEQSASAGARLVGAATAAFTVGGTIGGNRRRKGLIPSLGQATKAAALSVSTKKSTQKRIEVLNGYLQYLLSPTHMLSGCPELMLFVGSFFPLPLDVQTAARPVTNQSDSLGRLEMSRVVYTEEASKDLRQLIKARAPSRKLLDSSSRSLSSKVDGSSADDEQSSSNTPSSTKNEGGESVPGWIKESSKENTAEGNETAESAATAAAAAARVKEVDMIPSIKAKIDEVPLGQVRAALFEMVRYQFDFDNASFFRNRMFAALKTMSFAVTSSGEYRKMLYEAHIKYVNSESLAGWIEYGLNMLFPEGMFMQASPPLTEPELEEQSMKLKEALTNSFPEALISVLGQEIVKGGMDMLHEMLQNRLVVKSMAYMLFDLLWLEIFPELQDILTGGSALESDY